MSDSVNLPELGESITEGTVTRWLKAVGERVEVDEPLVEVATDKVDTEISSPIEGYIEEILVDEDETVEVGTPLVIIGAKPSSPSDIAPAASEKGAHRASSEQDKDQKQEAKESDKASESSSLPQASPQKEEKDQPSAGKSDEAVKKAEAPAAKSEAPKAEDKTEAKDEPKAERPDDEPSQQEKPEAPAQEASEDTDGAGESHEVVLPELGESVTEGTVTRWLKEVGEDVEVDEPLLEVSTDKVDTEIPSPVAGKLQKILVQEDETVEVGTALALVGSGTATAKSEAPKAEDKTEAKDEPKTERPDDEPSQQEKPEAPAQEASEDTDGAGESHEVVLPELGESVTEGTVTRWLKEVGEDVEVDEPLLEVSTDKVDTEIPSPVAGKLQKILVQEDETVEVGTALALVGSGTATAKSEAPKAQEKKQDDAPAAKEEPKTEEAQQEESKAEEPKDAPAEAEGAKGLYASPLVRKLAREQDIDLASIAGTGVGGRIRREDVIEAGNKGQANAPAPSVAEKSAPSQPAAAAAAAPVAKEALASGTPSATFEPSPLRGTTEKATRMRQVIAKRMKESLDVAAQLTQLHEVDMTRISKLRDAKKAEFLEREGQKLTFLPFFAKAVVEALQQHPKLNALFNEEAKEITYPDAEHLAIAVDTDRGLLVPVIKNAGDLSIADFAQKINDVAERTRSGKIGPDELSGGTFTITNFGSVGALSDTPIINQPQVAILGTGAIVKRPMVVKNAEGDDTIAVRSMVYLSLTYDHRLVDGADAGRFMQTLKKRLEAGEFDV